MRTLYKDDNIHIELNEEECWLEVDWTGLQTDDTVKRSCMIMLEILRDHKCSKVINDNSNVVGSWSEAVDWGAEVWFPAMMDAGLKHFAWVYSPSVFSRLSTDKTIDLTGKNIFKTFDDKQEAAQWLKEAVDAQEF
jgi:hypothetical protein